MGLPSREIRAHREITLRQGGHSAKAVGDEGKAVRIPKSTGCRDIALESQCNRFDNVKVVLTLHPRQASGRPIGSGASAPLVGRWCRSQSPDEVFVMAIPVSKPALLVTYGNSSVVTQSSILSTSMVGSLLSTKRGSLVSSKVTPPTPLTGWIAHEHGNRHTERRHSAFRLPGERHIGKLTHSSLSIALVSARL